MFEAKNFWIPSSIQTNSLYAKVETFEQLSPSREVEFIEKPFTHDSLSVSVNNFIDKFVENGDFSNAIANYTKANSQLNPNKFQLSTNKGRGFGDKEPFDAFYFDGSANLILGYGKLKNRVAVTAGIQFIKNIEVGGLKRDGMSPHDLIINQIQGPTHRPALPSDLGQKVQETFSHFRWEKLLVEIWIKWAEQAGLRKIFLMPSANNEWRDIRENKNQTAFLRYDITAKRLGFRQLKYGPYVLFLDNDLEMLYQTLLHPENINVFCR